MKNTIEKLIQANSANTIIFIFLMNSFKYQHTPIFFALLKLSNL